MSIDKQRDLLALKGLVSGTITELTDNEVQVDTVITLGQKFKGLTNLERVDTSRLSLAGDDVSYLFEGCTELKYVSLPNVEYIVYSMFSGCYKLQEVSIPLASKARTSAFYGCEALSNINFPLITKIENNAFSNCKALSSINFPAVTEIGNNAFESCSNLVNVTLRDITYIGSSAFAYCYGLVTMDLGASIESIYGAALRRCSSLLHLVIRNTNAVCVYDTTASNSDPSNGQLKIYVPRALLDSYKTATNWSRFANKFVALEDHTVDGTTTGELVT